MYKSTKTYGHEIGLSCAFRQWRARSHCQYVHGYSLAFKFVFEATKLDERNWVVDFGGLKALKAALVDKFDHKLVVAEDDPARAAFESLQRLGVAHVRFLPDVGVEKFAECAFNLARQLCAMQYGDRVRVVSCEVCEHGANSAIYEGEASGN